MSNDAPRSDTAGPAGLSTQFHASTDDVAAMYDGWAATYDDDLDSWDYDVPETIAAMLVHGGLPDGEILDAGCGTGRSGAALRAAGVHDVLGTDVSTASLAVARRRAAYTSTMVLDLTKPLPFDDNRFAAAVSAGVFSYLGDPEPVLRELLRVVQPAGQVIFSQRTDLWEAFGCEAVIRRLVDGGLCTAEVSTARPYLPKHPEFGTEIGVIYTTLTVAR